jgi:tetratricopeptide (TPR) repeat protein
MERPKHIICMILLLTSGFSSVSASWKRQIYDAYIHADMKQWKLVIDEMEKKKVLKRDYISELVNYQYGYIAWSTGTGKSSEARQYLGLAEKNLDWLNKNSKSDESLVHAYHSAFYGFRIGLNKIMAPVHGPKSVTYAKRAIELDADNPMGYIQYGNSQFYMPAVFGGSKKTAIEYYQKAQGIMEKNPSEIKYDWNYLNLMALIGQAFRDIGHISEAKKYYEKILDIEPAFLWVKNELYPEILKQTGNE